MSGYLSMVFIVGRTFSLAERETKKEKGTNQRHIVKYAITWKMNSGMTKTAQQTLLENITHLTEWIIILSKVWKGEIVVHQDLRIRIGINCIIRVFFIFKRRFLFTIITDRINDAEETEKKGNEERRARWATCKDLSSIYHQPRNVEAANA